MRFELFPILLMGLLASCEKPTPVSREIPAPLAAETTAALAASQLALAKSHLAVKSYGKAIPYLEAAIANGAPGEAETLLLDTLGKAHFSVPVARFTHPYPIRSFVRRDTSLFAALAGPHPTVVRWELGESPRVTAVLFPGGGEKIHHLSVVGKHLLVHRGATNLLCLAETLKPITNLGTFPAYLDPHHLQPFSENSLLLAHPTANDRNVTWHIRDSATGERLRSESLPLFPKAITANFRNTTLVILLEDYSQIEIPLAGEIVRIPSEQRSTDLSPLGTTVVITSGLRNLGPPPAVTAVKEDDAITIHNAIPNVGSISGRIPSTEAITGYRLNPATQELTQVPAPERLAALSKTFPEIPPTFFIHTCDTAVLGRLADAFPEKFPELTGPARAHADIIRKVFETGDRGAILAVIDSAPHGLPMATALYHAIESGDSEFLARTLAKAEDIPPPLAALAKRRSAMETDFIHLRRIGDWHGYESPDFTPLLNRYRKERADMLDLLTLPTDPTEDDISAIYAHLTDPDILGTLGKPLVAEKTIAAALSLAQIPEHAANALRLADLAQGLGTHPASRLRVRAAAFATLADFKAAYAAWIDLITNQPEAAHLPTDYSEAAHTAFETGDARKAMEILNTGMFRFPNDAAFAIRASWIALLTDHPRQALVFLERATKLGLPPDEIENTTALLAITHSQLGDPTTADSYLTQLIAISEKWENPGNIEALPWPEPFKSALREIISRQPETEHSPTPESDPKDTAPRSGESPIQEPPLPSR